MNIFKGKRLTLTILLVALAMIIGAVGTVDLVQKVFPGEKDTGASVSLGEQPGSTFTAGTPVPERAKFASTYIYYIGVGDANNWCIADPAPHGVPGGAGTHLVLWRCQPQPWFGWRASIIRSGPYGGVGYFQIYSQAHPSLCMQTSRGAIGGAIFLAHCNGTIPNQVWEGLTRDVDHAFLQALGSGNDGNRNLTNKNAILKNGNPIVEGPLFRTCSRMPWNQFWTAVQGGDYVWAC